MLHFRHHQTCMYVCMYVCTCVSKRITISNISLPKRLHKLTYKSRRAFALVQSRTSAHILKYTNAYVHARSQPTQTHTYMHMYSESCNSWKQESAPKFWRHRRLWKAWALRLHREQMPRQGHRQVCSVCMHDGTGVCMHVYMSMYAYLHVCVCVCCVKSLSSA